MDIWQRGSACTLPPAVLPVCCTCKYLMPLMQLLAEGRRCRARCSRYAQHLPASAHAVAMPERITSHPDMVECAWRIVNSPHSISHAGGDAVFMPEFILPSSLKACAWLLPVASRCTLAGGQFTLDHWNSGDRSRSDAVTCFFLSLPMPKPVRCKSEKYAQRLKPYGV